jgi:DNA polymerase III delta subunit
LIFVLSSGKIFSMKYTELKNDIKEGAKSIYLLEGDDAYFRQKGEEMIKSAFVSMPELNYSSFDGETLKGSALTSLVSALESFPFMSEKRLVKVSNFYPSESEFEHYLKKLFENFPADSILLIVNQEGKKGVDLKRKKIVTYVDCNRADEETVTKWAYITLKRANITASVEVCSLIARYCLCNMARVALEVEKIIDYKVSGELSATEVDELVYKDRTIKCTNLQMRSQGVTSKSFAKLRANSAKRAGMSCHFCPSYIRTFATSIQYISQGIAMRSLRVS